MQDNPDPKAELQIALQAVAVSFFSARAGEPIPGAKRRYVEADAIAEAAEIITLALTESSAKAAFDLAAQKMGCASIWPTNAMLLVKAGSAVKSEAGKS